MIMKILVISKKGLITSIGHQMSLEGDEVTTLGMVPDKVNGFDFILTDTRLPPQDLPVIGGDEDFPSSVVQAMGYDVTKGPSNFIVIKWFDYVNGWSDQTIIGIPLIGLMNESLGPPTPTGIALRYSNDSPLTQLFSITSLSNGLHQMRHTGFVTITCTLTPSNYMVTGISTHVPYHGLFAILEGTSDRLSDFFLDPTHLKESWTAAILVTRYPFPHQAHSSRAFIKGLTDEVLRHLWMPFVTSHRNSHFLDNTLVGISTAWSPHLTEANRRALRTCRAIQLDQKQYRTDLGTVAQHGWSSLVKRGLVPQRDNQPNQGPEEGIKDKEENEPNN